jgi:hypothetical protein
MKASKPAGSVTSKKRASPSELTVKVCGVSWGPKTKDLTGAVVTWPSAQMVSSPSGS